MRQHVVLEVLRLSGRVLFLTKKRPLKRTCIEGAYLSVHRNISGIEGPDTSKKIALEGRPEGQQSIQQFRQQLAQMSCQT